MNKVWSAVEILLAEDAAVSAELLKEVNDVVVLVEKR